MNLIVTAGGTKERIDAVRTITNEATGRLGSLIAQEFSQRLAAQEHTIYYLCGKSSILPQMDHSNIRVISIEGTGQLQAELNALLSTGHIDAVVHSMAVSDYRVRGVTTADFVAERIAEKFIHSQIKPTRDEWRNIILEAIEGEPTELKRKISSGLEHPILLLEKTPKIISMIKKISPQTTLVGFKLLSGVSEEMLIQTAYRLLQKNKCDFVFANDTNSMKDGNHDGCLIDSNKNMIRYSGKEQIAKGIVDCVLKKLSEGAN